MQFNNLIEAFKYIEESTKDDWIFFYLTRSGNSWKAEFRGSTVELLGWNSKGEGTTPLVAINDALSKQGK